MVVTKARDYRKLILGQPFRLFIRNTHKISPGIYFPWLTDISGVVGYFGSLILFAVLRQEIYVGLF